MSSEQTTNNEQKPKPRKSPLVALLLAFLALLLAMGSAGYFWMQNKQLNAHLSSIQNSLNTSQRGEQRNVNQLRQSIQQTQQNMQQQKDQLANTRNQIRHLNSNDNHSLTLARAKYLIKLADYNLRYMHNVKDALTLLSTANELIAKLDEPSLLPLRQALTQDITALKSVSMPDIPGILSQLQAMQQQINNTKLITPQPIAPKPTPSSNSAMSHTWQQQLRDSLKEIEKVVVIRRTDTLPKPMLSEVQERYLRENLELMLNQAQWAAMRGDNAIYQNSLQRATDMLKENFNDSSLKNLLQEIETLQTTNINPALPSLQKSLIALDQVIHDNTTTPPGSSARHPVVSSSLPIYIQNRL